MTPTMTTNHGTFGPRLGRLLGVSASVGIGLSLALAPMASAATPTPTVSSTDLNAAAQVASSPATTARLGAFFVHLDERNANSGKPGLRLGPVSPAAVNAKAAHLVSQTEAVYSLNPAFVAGDKNASVAQFAYASTEARSSSGQTGSVWVVRDKATGQWKLFNLSSTTEEVSYPAQGAGDLVFTEPQIHAWYRVHGQQVLPLNDTARTSVGANGVDLGAYQAMVHTRYGDKLPGSAYAKAGKLGGFNPSTAAAAAPGGYGYALPGSVGLAGAVAVGGLFYARKRRASQG
jgi:hypothetical protein